MQRLSLGISSCLLGNNVRFNKGHKLSRFCRDSLGEFADFTAICPEMAIGLGVPRPTIRLISTDAGTRVVESDNYERDHTDALQSYSQNTAPTLSHLDGYILMQKSPTCGMEKVKVYQPNGYGETSGVGVFTAAIKQAQPLMPLEEAGRLEDSGIRENFLIRVYLYQRLKQLLNTAIKAKQLLDFHSDHKYLLMAHSVEAYKTLGRMLSDLKRNDPDVIKWQYAEALMQALAKPASRKKHTNVMQHLFGYLRELISPSDKTELLQLIEQYRTGIVPLIVPLTLLKHHFFRFPQECGYILRQVYLQPYPESLGLRNNI